MKLCESESIGVFDDHDGCIRDIDADFDDNRRDERINLTCAESIHHGIALRRFHATVHRGESCACECAS